MSRFLIAATAVVTAVQALALEGVPAKVTQAVVPDATFHRSEITPGPSIRELMKRDDNATVLFAPDNTCGYVSGRAGAAYTCNLDYTCGFIIEGSVGAVGCCTSTVCGMRYDCLDYQQVYSQSACDDGCMQDTYTAKCTSTDLPYCGTVSFFSGIRDYYCASIKISTVQQLYTTYDGETDGRSFEQFIITNTPTASDGDLTISEGPTDGGGGFSFSRTTPAPSSSSSPTDGDNNSGNDGVNGSNGGNNDGSNSNNDNGNGNGGKSSKSATPIGPIVGGVVGGVAALGLIGLGTFFLIRRNRNGAAGASAAAAGGSGPAQQPPMQQQPGAPGYPQQPYGYPPQQVQGYYPGASPGTDQKPAGFVDMAPVPDRHDSTSPVSQFSDSRYSSVSPQAPMGVPQQQQPPHSPASTLASSNWGPQPGQVQQQSNVPPTVHEAGGNVVGERDYNANHRGQFHELQ